jgi:hypothetical protein
MTDSENINLIQKAKSMLPNMPDEVFNTWLVPIIRSHNAWPYLNVLSPHPDDQWRRYFGLFTFYDISNLLWDVMQLKFDWSCLDPLSNGVIEVLIENDVHNFDATGTFNVRDSKSRFFWHMEFIKRTGNIVAPVIGINTKDGLRVIDGNHRLAALTHLGFRGRINCDTWIGHP